MLLYFLLIYFYIIVVLVILTGPHGFTRTSFDSVGILGYTQYFHGIKTCANVKIVFESVHYILRERVRKTHPPDLTYIHTLHSYMHTYVIFILILVDIIVGNFLNMLTKM